MYIANWLGHFFWDKAISRQVCAVTLFILVIIQQTGLELLT